MQTIYSFLVTGVGIALVATKNTTQFGNFFKVNIFYYRCEFGSDICFVHYLRYKFLPLVPEFVTGRLYFDIILAVD